MGSIGALTPNPHRADREVDGEPGADAQQVREQVEKPEPGEHLDYADVEHERDQRDQAEAGEPAAGQPHPLERPHLVQHVVVHDRNLDGDHRGGQQGDADKPVQRHQDAVVDHDPAGPHHEEPAYPRQCAPGAGPLDFATRNQVRTQRRRGGRLVPRAIAGWRHHRPFQGRVAAVAGTPTRSPGTANPYGCPPAVWIAVRGPCSTLPTCLRQRFPPRRRLGPSLRSPPPDGYRLPPEVDLVRIAVPRPFPGGRAGYIRRS